MTLSLAQVRAVAAAAGFPNPDLMAAVAMAESGGDPRVVRDTRGQSLPPGQYPEYSVGLWQINLLASPQYTAAQMMDPATNARAAYALSNGGTNLVGPWYTTMTSGRYRAWYPPPANTVVAPPRRRSDDGTVVAVLGALALAGAAGYAAIRQRAVLA